MLKETAAGINKRFSGHCVEVGDCPTSHHPLDDLRRLGRIFHPTEFGRIVADAGLTGDEEHDGGDVRGKDCTVVQGATDRHRHPATKPTQLAYQVAVQWFSS